VYCICLARIIGRAAWRMAKHERYWNESKNKKEEAIAFANLLHGLVEEMKIIVDKYQVKKMESRVRELKLSTAAELSTRQLERSGSGIPAHASAAHVADDDISLQTSQVESVAAVKTAPLSILKKKKAATEVKNKSVYFSDEMQYVSMWESITLFFL
jgi:hypothetical protein